MTFSGHECIKTVFGWGSAHDPAGGPYDALPDPLIGWGGKHPSHPLSGTSTARLDLRLLRHLSLPADAGVSLLYALSRR